ncbi:MAG TPA: hypothetical protein VKB96_18840 [Gammaproteobacteria bacterium]|nr:hypothetical protein [Gammaproteobacteria bacterium]
MPRKSKTDQERGYARSAWDELRDIEDEFKAAVFITMTPEHRPGVWKLRISCSQVLASFGTQPIDTAIAVIWPNAHDQAFTGALWDSFIKLRAMAEEQAGMIHTRPHKDG